MFSDDERRALFIYCRNHGVASCCGKTLQLLDMAADIIPIRREALCPGCRRSLIEDVRAHLQKCPDVLANIAAEALRQRERARNLVKESHRLYALIDVKMREVEAKQAELEARRRQLAPDPPASGSA